MNLKKLFDMQGKLDEKILERFPHLRNEDLLPKKILALQVELGELCNCWRGFKFWSNDQKPRTEVPVKYYSGGPTEIENWLLEEYVDCLHFILSIGFEIGVCPEELYVEPIFCANVTEQFIDLFYEVSLLRYEERNGRLYEDYLRYDLVLEHFVGLGKLLGFTWEQIEESYFEKNRINHERQKNGY